MAIGVAYATSMLLWEMWFFVVVIAATGAAVREINQLIDASLGAILTLFKSHLTFTNTTTAPQQRSSNAYWLVRMHSLAGRSVPCWVRLLMYHGLNQLSQPVPARASQSTSELSLSQSKVCTYLADDCCTCTVGRYPPSKRALTA